MLCHNYSGRFKIFGREDGVVVSFNCLIIILEKLAVKIVANF